MSQRHRYPGVRPFEGADADLFFGRDRDKADLLGLIAIEKLIVLFGKSGYGKSSLLNAAIIPALKQKGVNAFSIRCSRLLNTDQPWSQSLIRHFENSGG